MQDSHLHSKCLKKLYIPPQPPLIIQNAIRNFLYKKCMFPFEGKNVTCSSKVMQEPKFSYLLDYSLHPVAPTVQCKVAISIQNTKNKLSIPPQPPLFIQNAKRNLLCPQLRFFPCKTLLILFFLSKSL